MTNESIREPVTVVIPALNEEQTIAPLLDALLAGTRPPEEIVVSDGGSTDSTREIVARYAERDVRLIEGPGGISENRNAAIEAASHELIACTDAGCIPDPTWLERLIAPLEAGAQWAGGLSRPARTSRLQKIVGLAMMPSPEEVDLAHFVPGGASQAFTRDVWRRAGGFPEGMLAGEDTVFGQRIKDLGIEPAVVPDAQVTWQAPRTVGEMVRKAFLWGRADGSVGTNSTGYLKVFVIWVGGTALGLLLPALRLPRLGITAMAGVLGASAWMTRRKHRALDDALGSVVLPAAHALRTGSQGLGWALGYLARTDRPPIKRLAELVGARIWMKAKQTLRPYIPDTLMTRLRKSGIRGAVGSRNNVDILVPNREDVDLWLNTTPDTYRVGVEPTRLVSSEQPMVVRPETATPETRDRLAAAVGGDVVAAAIATASPPEDGAAEPTIDPFAVAVKPGALEVPLPSDVSTLQHLIRQAGLHQAVIPVSGLEPQPSRRPISGPGAVVILGTVPMRDVGGGSRGAQMAHELVARGYHVTYLSLFDSDEQRDLGLRYVHSALDEIAAADFDLERFLGRLQTETRVAIVELPHPRYQDLIESLSGLGFAVAYDLMDDWSDDALGGWGYTQAVETEIAGRCDALIASAPSLVERLERLSGRAVTLVPNAVNIRLFDPGDDLARPDDLPYGDGPVLEYHGSLYGDWFDWKALERTALAHADARLVIIGDDRRHPPMPTNVHFLGLKPQHLLPAYLAHTDVAMIPFEVSDTTHAVSPLKVFEYLAMGVPVASVPLEPLDGLEGVYTDEDLVMAVTEALNADTPDAAAVAIAHGWGERLRRLFDALGLDLQQDPNATPIHITQHPVIHWQADQRRL